MFASSQVAYIVVGALGSCLGGVQPLEVFPAGCATRKHLHLLTKLRCAA